MKIQTMQVLLLCAAALALGACSRHNPLGDGSTPGLRDRAPDDGAGGAAAAGGTGGTSGGVAAAGTSAGGGFAPVPSMTGGGGTSAGPAMPAPGGVAGTRATAGFGGMFGGVAGAAAGGGAAMCSPDGWCCYADGVCCHTPSGTCSSGGPGFPPGEPPTTDEPWEPPFELGEPGWQDSVEPLCTEQRGFLPSYSVWADSRGVFALVDGGNFSMGVPIDGRCPEGRCAVRTIYVNRGSGWEPYHEDTATGFDFLLGGELRLAGVDNGPLFLYGHAHNPSGPCGLATITPDGERTCAPVYSMEHLFVVGSDLGYGVLEGELVRYDGTSWGPLPSVVQSTRDIARVWATPTKVFATSHSAGRIYTLSDGALSVENTQTLVRFSSIWGFADDDVWAGSESGTLFHYDGSSWSELEWPASEGCPPSSDIIRSMWGADGVVYFASHNRIGRVVDGQVETLAEWQCQMRNQPVYVTSLWGRGRDEVFFSLIDERIPQQECGSTFLLHYDGAEFHRL